LVKSEVAEALQEQRALVKEIVEEAIEEIALTRAIDEGLETKPVTRDESLPCLRERAVTVEFLRAPRARNAKAGPTARIEITDTLSSEGAK